MTAPARYRPALEGFGDKMHAVKGDQWGEPVRCCPEWDVRELVRHVVEETRWAPPLLAGETAPEIEDHIDGDLLGEDPPAAWDDAAQRAAEAVEEPGAMERAVRPPSGDVQAREYLSEVFADTLIHTFDLARTTGSDDRLDPQAIDACATWFDTVEEEWRRRGDIGPAVAVPPGADAQARLLAGFGCGR